MENPRTVEIHINAVESSQIIEATDRDEAFRALGYLAQWNQTFRHVKIYCVDPEGLRGAPEISATYRKEANGQICYAIAAVWNPESKQFGFHS